MTGASCMHWAGSIFSQLLVAAGALGQFEDRAHTKAFFMPPAWWHLLFQGTCPVLQYLAARQRRPCSHICTLASHLCYGNKNPILSCRQLPDYCMLVRRCLVTPTRIVRLPPETELSNRILRRYKQYADRFMRVSFAEENAGIMHLGGKSSTITDLVTRCLLTTTSLPTIPYS